MKTAVVELPPIRPTVAPYSCGVLNKIIKRFEPQCEIIDLNLDFWDYIWTEYFGLWDKCAGNVIYHLSKEKLCEAVRTLKQNRSSEQAVQEAFKTLQRKSSLYEEQYNISMRFGRVEFPDEVYKNLLEFCSQKTENIFGEYLDSVMDQKELKNYDLLFLSVMVKEQLVCACTFSKLMTRKYGTRPRIVIGGAYITRFSEGLKQAGISQLFDVWLPGLAEVTIPNLFGCCNTDNSSYEYDTDLGALRLEQYYSLGKIFPLMASRFCYYHRCSFCDNAYNYRGRKIDIQTPEAVFEQMKNANATYGVDRFCFLDDCLSDSFMNRLSELIISNNCQFNWTANARFTNRLTDIILVNKLAKGGCRELFLGLESYSQPELDRMNKGIKVDWVQPTIVNLKKSGITVYISVMVGFPGQDVEDFAATYDFLRENEPYIDMVDVNIFFKTPFFSGDPLALVELTEEDIKSRDKQTKRYYNQLMTWVADKKKSPSFYRRHSW